MKTPLTAEQRMIKATVDITNKDRYIALAGVLMIGERTIDDTVPTACTNGRDERYGRAFVDSMGDAEFRFLMLHENYHKLYKHLTTWDFLHKVDTRLANESCDYVINLRISDENKDGFAVMPKCGLIDERFRGMDTLQVFNILKQEKDQRQGNGEPEDSGESMDEHDWEGAQEMTEADNTELAKDLDEAIRQGALMAGKVGSGGSTLFDDLLTPTVDWREVLSEFVTTTCTGNDYSTWARPSRRFIAAGVYMPSGISESVGELVIACDTSFSVVSKLHLLLSEVQGMANTVKPEKIRLLYWDTQVAGEEIYLPGEMEQLGSKTKPTGGGGTDVRCVPQYLAEHGVNPQAVIVLTDGYIYGGWGNWTAPVLWCILDNPRTFAPIGKTVHIKSGSR